MGYFHLQEWSSGMRRQSIRVGTDNVACGSLGLFCCFQRILQYVSSTVEFGIFARLKSLRGFCSTLDDQIDTHYASGV
eukprot:c24908_g1_i1 orf=425-658(-)